MRRNVEIEVDPTGQELGIEFSKMGANEQAICLTEIAKQFNEFGDESKKFLQLLFISESDELKQVAKDFIKELNDYVNNKY